MQHHEKYYFIQIIPLPYAAASLKVAREGNYEPTGILESPKMQKTSMVHFYLTTLTLYFKYWDYFTLFPSSSTRGSPLTQSPS